MALISGQKDVFCILRLIVSRARYNPHLICVHMIMVRRRIGIFNANAVLNPNINHDLIPHVINLCRAGYVTRSVKARTSNHGYTDNIHCVIVSFLLKT